MKYDWEHEPDGPEKYRQYLREHEAQELFDDIEREERSEAVGDDFEEDPVMCEGCLRHVRYCGCDDNDDPDFNDDFPLELEYPEENDWRQWEIHEEED